MLMNVWIAMEGVLRSVTTQRDRFLVDAMRDTYSILMRSVVMVSDLKPLQYNFFSVLFRRC